MSIGSAGAAGRLGSVPRGGPTSTGVTLTTVESAVVWRIRRAAVCAVLFAVAFVQAPGKVVADTKLDLTQAPGDFLTRALHLWDPVGFGGQVQNQAYGYLFPIGPFHALGEALGIPGWAVQRLWWGVLLSVAFLGVAALCRRLRIGTGWAQIIAGVAFALSPRVLSTLGPVSAEAWPMVLAPWAIIPLVDAARTGRLARGAALSAVAVAVMGGVNAALTFAALLPAASYIATRRPFARAVRLLGWWALAVTMATLWWLVPLLLLGRYSPPFLDYIETADVTTSPTSMLAAVRGASHWVGYLGPELGATWQAGHDLVTVGALVLATALVAAIGLFGLCLRGMRERGWLVSLLVVGCVAVTFGHVGPGSPWFADQTNDLLDGVLAPLRNVHKFDPLIRIPLALGLAHAVAVAPRMLRRLDGGRFAAASAIGLVLVAIGAAAAPVAADRVAPSGSFEAIPGYWSEAASWLKAEDAQRTLLVPGSRFARYGWGSPMDEPIQALDDVPWEVRNAIPLVPPAHIRMLDAIEERLAAGTPSSGLASYLARSGISHLLVRNDLDPVATSAPSPARVHQALDGSPGLRLVASFGPEIAAQQIDNVYVDAGIGLAKYPSLEVYEVRDVQPEVTTTPDTDAVSVVGGPESLLDLGDAAVLGTEQPALLAAQNSAGLRPRQVALTDGLQKRELDFGRSLDNASPVRTPGDSSVLDRPESDYEVSGNARMRTYGDWAEVTDVRVSSSLADVTAGTAHDRSAGPASAFDGGDDTAWRAISAPGGDGPAWLEVDFEQPQSLEAIDLTLADAATETTTDIQVVTDGERVTAEGTSEQPDVHVPLSGDPVSTLRIELSAPGGQRSEVGIAELVVPGVPIRHVLVPPVAHLEPDQSAAVVLSAPAGHADACVVAEFVTCSPTFAQLGEEEYAVNRRIELDADRTYDLSVAAAPRAGTALDKAIAGSSGTVGRITASSSSVADPLGGPMATVDGDIGTGWVAGPLDDDPTLVLRWPEPVEINGLDLSWSPDLAASRPGSVTISANGRSRQSSLEDAGRVSFPQLRTKEIELHFSGVQPAYNFDSVEQRYTELPMGISELRLLGADRQPGAPLLTSSKLADFTCGEGPDVVVDGQRLRTEGSVAVAGLSRLATADLTVCDASEVDLSAGPHDVDLVGDDLWRPVRLSMIGPDWSTTASPTAPSVGSGQDRGSRWQAEVDAAAPSLLTVRLNANDGWRAHADGEQLGEVDVDGWMQGYLLPAGTTDVTVAFAPARAYQVALGVGLVVLVVLLAGAAFVGRRTSGPPLRPMTVAPALGAVLVVVTGVVLGGWTGLLAAGLAFAAVIAIGSSMPSRGRSAVIAGAVAGCLLLVSGTLRAWPPVDLTSSGLTWTIQLCSLLAVLLVAIVATGRLEVRPLEQPVDADLESPRESDADERGQEEDVSR